MTQKNQRRQILFSYPSSFNLTSCISRKCNNAASKIKFYLEWFQTFQELFYVYILYVYSIHLFYYFKYIYLVEQTELLFSYLEFKIKYISSSISPPLMYICLLLYYNCITFNQTTITAPTKPNNINLVNLNQYKRRKKKMVCIFINTLNRKVISNKQNLICFFFI